MTTERRSTGTRFQVVFDDRHLVVVDKAALVLTVPTRRGERNTLVQLLERSLRVRRLEIVHRLDRDTSGLLVFAKHREAGDGLREQFREHAAERRYLAVVAGELPWEEGTFDSYLATGRNLTRHSTRGGERGERAVTHFRVLANHAGATLVEVELETGRRNQIRVHFAEAGHPVLGERRYRPEIASHPLWPQKRLALHAAILGFRHPMTGEPLSWESPPPAPFRPFLGRGPRVSRR